MMSSQNSELVVPTPLMAACSAGDLPTLRSLLSAEGTRGDQDARLSHLLAEATKKRHLKVVEYLLEQTTNIEFPKDLIFSAISAGLDVYKLYLAKNPDILKYEWRGLGDVVCITLACYMVDFLTYPLETAGAEPGRSLDRSPRRYYRFLPLEFAAYSSTEANARLLLRHGAVINGTEALQLAADYGKLGMVRLLVEAGGDVNGMIDPKSLYGSHSETRGTALHFAAEKGFKDIVRYLMDNGADPNILNASGYTAKERAQIKGHHEVVRLIQSYEM